MKLLRGLLWVLLAVLLGLLLVAICGCRTFERPAGNPGPGASGAYRAEAPNLASVTLAWDASASTNAAGYFLYWGGASGSYTNRVDAGTNLQASVPGLERGQAYWFAATAYDETVTHQSDFSNEISYLVPPVPAQVFVLTVLSSTHSSGPFAAEPGLAPMTVTNADGQPRFYRLEIKSPEAGP